MRSGVIHTSVSDDLNAVTTSCAQDDDDGIVVGMESRGEQPQARPPKLLDRVRAVIRARHYSRRTEGTYAHWVRRYIVFHGRVHPSTLGAEEDQQIPRVARGRKAGQRFDAEPGVVCGVVPVSRRAAD